MPKNRFKLEPTSDLSPEKIFERELVPDFVRPRSDPLARGNKPPAAGRIVRPVEAIFIEDAESGDYDAAGARVNMPAQRGGGDGARWRERYKKLVHEEILRTVADPREIEEELRRFSPQWSRKTGRFKAGTCLAPTLANSLGLSSETAPELSLKTGN